MGKESKVLKDLISKLNQISAKDHVGLGIKIRNARIASEGMWGHVSEKELFVVSVENLVIYRVSVKKN